MRYAFFDLKKNERNLKMLCTKNSLQTIVNNLQQEIGKIETFRKFEEIIMVSEQIGKQISARLTENILQQRAQEPTIWGNCRQCGHKLYSKGFIARQMNTVLGLICWQRRVGRCPQGCRGEQFAPFDQELGIEAYQQTSVELKLRACMLAVFIPFTVVSLFLSRLLAVKISDTSVWKWVQHYGAKRQATTQQELNSEVVAENIPSEIAKLPLLIGADGIKVPFRPDGGKPKGKARWQEIKVAVLARLASKKNSENEVVHQLKQRRLVALLGSSEELSPLLWQEALRQKMTESSLVTWICDGGTGFWSIFYELFAAYAIGILDFYHAAQNLWKGAAAWLDGRTSQAKEWFEKARHDLRHENVDKILLDLVKAQSSTEISEDNRKVIKNLYEYLDEHREHIHYSLFKDVIKLPIGSGIVESACKWLIQQRFKGVGMRWSEKGFTNLLQLRLAWVNERFEKIFFDSPN